MNYSATLLVAFQHLRNNGWVAGDENLIYLFWIHCI